MKNKLTDGRMKELFGGLAELPPGLDLPKKIRRRIFREKFRLPVAIHFFILGACLAVLPFSYHILVRDFVKFEILPMLDSIINNFEFSFDFVSDQINFASAFLPFDSMLIFSFNLAISILAAVWVLKDLKRSRFAAGLVLALGLWSVLGSGPAAAKAVEEETTYDRFVQITQRLGQSDEPIPFTLTGIIEEVDEGPGQLFVSLRTINKKEFAVLRGESIPVYLEEGKIEIVKRGFERAGIKDLAEGDRVTVIGFLDSDTFTAKKIVAAAPWWKRIFGGF